MILKIFTVLILANSIVAKSTFPTSRNLTGVDPNSLQCDPEGLKPLLLPHHKDCDKFYMCTHGQEVLFSCPEGTIFDFARQICNWPRDVECILRDQLKDSSEEEEDEDGSGGGDVEWGIGDQETERPEITTTTLKPDEKPPKPDHKPPKPDEKPPKPDHKPPKPDHKPPKPDHKPPQPDEKPSKPDHKPPKPDHKPPKPDDKPSTPDLKPSKPNENHIDHHHHHNNHQQNSQNNNGGILNRNDRNESNRNENNQNRNGNDSKRKEEKKLKCNDPENAGRQEAHRSDCQRYWKCIDGHLHQFSCSDGLFYNQKKQQCDHEGNVKCDVDSDELNNEYIVV